MQLPRMSHGRPIVVATAALLMAIAPGCSAHGRSGEARGGSDRAMHFLCSADNLKSGAAGMDPAAVCALFKTEIERALGRTLVQAPASGTDGDRISVAVRASGPVTVSATVTRRVDGRESTLPDMAVDVSDRPIALSDIGMLAAQVARTVADFYES